jgi:anti-sigma factor RsiW
MTCREARSRLEREGKGDLSEMEREALTRHLDTCERCAEAARVARLSSLLLRALRQDLAPGPAFYARLRARMAAAGIDRIDAPALAAWGFARRLVPALALGVLLLAGVTVSLDGPLSPQRVRVAEVRDLYAFSLEEVGLPGAAERPDRDQMLAFVLTRGTARDAAPDARGTGPGE